MDFSDNGNRIEALHGGDVYRNDVRLDFSVNLNLYLHHKRFKFNPHLNHTD